MTGDISWKEFGTPKFTKKHYILLIK